MTNFGQNKYAAFFKIAEDELAYYADSVLNQT